MLFVFSLRPIDVYMENWGSDANLDTQYLVKIIANTGLQIKAAVKDLSANFTIICCVKPPLITLLVSSPSAIKFTLKEQNAIQ